MQDQCYVTPTTQPASADEINDARMATLAIWGMGCRNCGTRAQNALLALEGVVSAAVDWERGLAYVDYVPTKTNLHALILAVAGAGDDERHNYRAEIIF